MYALTIKEAVYALRSYYSNADDIERIILDSATAAAAANVVGGTIPFLAVPAAITASFASVWVMYVRICKKLDISLSENVLKLLARAALTNIAANLTGYLIALVIGMILPGGSAVAAALVGFITVYVAGKIFLNFLVRMTQRSTNLHSFSDISTEEMKKTIRNVKVDKEDLTSAKTSYDNRNA